MSATVNLGPGQLDATRAVIGDPWTIVIRLTGANIDWTIPTVRQVAVVHGETTVDAAVTTVSQTTDQYIIEAVWTDTQTASIPPGVHRWAVELEDVPQDRELISGRFQTITRTIPAP